EFMIRRDKGFCTTRGLLDNLEGGQIEVSIRITQQAKEIYTDTTAHLGGLRSATYLRRAIGDHVDDPCRHQRLRIVCVVNEIFNRFWRRCLFPGGRSASLWRMLVVGDRSQSRLVFGTWCFTSQGQYTC